MSEEHKPFSKFEDLGSDIKNYAEIRIELAKLELAEKTSQALTRLIQHIMIGIFLALFVAFVTLALALWVSDLLGSYALGFLIVSLAYLLIALVIKWTGPLWRQSLRDSFIKSFFDGN